MAIISSVLTGKAKGKIGNIVLATVKGQTTAREYNPNPTYSDSAGQTLQRGRLRNAVMAWQFLNIFMQYAKPLAKSTESVYNAFIRLVVNLLPEVAYATRAEAGAQALAELLYAGNFVTLSSPVLGVGEIVVDFNSNYFPWSAGVKLYILSYNSATGYRYLKIVDISEAQWISGAFEIADAAFTGDSAAAFVLSADGSKMSNISNLE